MAPRGHKLIDSMAASLRWLADSPNPAIRGRRLTAWLYALKGPEAFSCRTLSEICKTQRTPPATFFAYLAELKAMGMQVFNPRGVLEYQENCKDSTSTDMQDCCVEVLE